MNSTEQKTQAFCYCPRIPSRFRNLETHLPVIPPEVEEVRFRWSAGDRKYKYNFYRYDNALDGWLS